MTNFEQHKLSKAKSRSHNREQELPILPPKLVDKCAEETIAVYRELMNKSFNEDTR